jgi:hypothetical protein
MVTTLAGGWRIEYRATGASGRRRRETGMDETIVQQIVDECLSAMEPLDTQSAAVLQFLKDKGIASDEELAAYLEEAGKASNVRWLAARVRIKSLIASAMKTEKAPERPEGEDEKDKKSAEPVAEGGPSTRRVDEKDSAAEQGSEKGDGKAEEGTEGGAQRSENQKERPPAEANEAAKQEAA